MGDAVRKVPCGRVSHFLIIWLERGKFWTQKSIAPHAQLVNTLASYLHAESKIDEEDEEEEQHHDVRRPASLIHYLFYAQSGTLFSRVDGFRVVRLNLEVFGDEGKSMQVYGATNWGTKRRRMSLLMLANVATQLRT